jgi:uncharacterized protein with LGFP repeats
LLQKYLAKTGPSGFLGFPLSDITPIAGGDVNYFKGNGKLICQYHGPSGSSGGIYWSAATGAWEVHSCLFETYLASGGPAGRLGFPLSDEFTNPQGYEESDFVGGTIKWINGAGVVTLNCVGTGLCS